MDPLYRVLFPLLVLGFAIFDWPKLRKSTTLGVRSIYLLITAIAALLYGLRAAGIEPPSPIRFSIEKLSPVVESILGLK